MSHTLNFFFFKALKEAGFRVKDRRLQETMANFAQYLQQENFEGFVDETTFRRYQFNIFFFFNFSSFDEEYLHDNY